MSVVQDLAGLTPLMKQYMAIRQEYPDSVLLFQVGDFYEIFFDDARKVSEFLGITLTKRGELNGVAIPLCGFPMHSVDHYIPRLVKGGFKIALCDQLEPATAGKMVARGVTNVFTPGTLVADNLLDAKSNSYLFSFFPTKSGYGLLFSELLTSQLHATVIPHGSMRQLETELFRFLPDEVIVLANKAISSYDKFFKERGFFTTVYDTAFDQTVIEQETQWLETQFDPQSFAKLQQCMPILYATILWKRYVQKTQEKALSQVRSIAFYKPEAFLILDGATQKNLDIVKNSFDGTRSHTLLSLMDQAVTSMGSRMVKRWLLTPLADKEVILSRQDCVQKLVQDAVLLQDIVQIFEKIGDLQRVIGRIALDKAQLQDYVMLHKMLTVVPQLQQILYGSGQAMLQAFAQSFVDFSQVQQLLASACHDDPFSDGLIKAGYHAQLDGMRDLLANSSQKILALEQVEIERSGINSLKIRQNNVQGYYIEITKTHFDDVPENYREIQTLVNRKRFVTPELQILQSEIMVAQQQFSVLEKELFDRVKLEVKAYVHDIRVASQTIATLDGLVAMARVALQWGWTRPQFHDRKDIIIRDGKHPIVAATLSEKFISNNTDLTDEQQLWIVTGPNMGGKSTYLRQNALICLLAQVGSFVPASHAQLPILDRIFTRIGAGDFLAQGKSTFLVEMEETAQILHAATDKSLIILDEVGRGTSTYDGLALAQAIVEYIVHNIKAKSLFATHYHELTQLQGQLPGVVSFYADSVQTETGIIFLHKIVPGSADSSFGIEVAKLAHVPAAVVARASEILQTLHQTTTSVVATAAPVNSVCCSTKETFTAASKAEATILSKIDQLSMDDLTPRQALDLLWQWKSLLQK